MLGRGIDHHVGAERNGAGKDRGGENIVDDDQRAVFMGDVGHHPDVDHLQGGIGGGFEEDRGGVGADGGAPLVEIGAVDEGHLDPEAGQQVFEDVKAGTKERARGDDVIARAQAGHERGIDGGHAGGGGEGILGPFEPGDPLLEHRHGGVAVAGIDEFVRSRLDKAGLGGFGAVVDEALGEEDRLAHLAILRPAGAAMHQRGAGVPFLAHHSLLSGAACPKKKPPAAVMRRG